MTIIPVMYFHLLLLSLLIGSSSAQTGTCSPTSVTGPAIPSCPVGQVQDSGGNCCPPSGLLTTAAPTTAAPVTTAAATVIVTLPGGGSTQVVVTSGTSVTSTTNTTCVDKLNPLTGVSDCPARASLCNDATYYSVMTVQCPKTCGRCSNTTTTSGTCVDLRNPQTGVSDCPSRISLCNSTVYYSVMTAQCPKTCGRCNGTNTTTTTTTTNGTCVDLTNPSTGISDCPSRIAYCTNSAYLTLMRTQCPRTCGFCTSTNSTTTSSVTVTSTGCADLINPSTGTSDCPGAAYLCNNASYTTLMRAQCPRTCGFCSG